MTEYRPLDPAVFHGCTAAGDPSSTWINLGFWPKANPSRTPAAYLFACESMARTVGEAAEIQAGASVLDIGCGCGDSLLLWKHEFKCSQVVGVNVTASECQTARAKCGEDVTIVHRDGIALLDDIAAGEDLGPFDVVLSVDALYHVQTRQRFLQGLARKGVLSPLGSRRFAAIDTFGAVDIFSREELAAGHLTSAAAFRRSPLRTSALWVISKCSGIPLPNLLYSSQFVDTIAGGKFVHLSVVTDQVLLPFAQFASREGWLALKGGQLARGVQLLAASGFMRVMAWSGLVQVAVYGLVIPSSSI